MNQDFIPIWRVASPTQTATNPEWMSFHLLSEAERCPLASTLRRSTYAQLWDGRGYPKRPAVSAAIGIVVHSAAQFLMQELMTDGVASNRDEGSFETLRRLGGFSAVLNKEVSAFVRNQGINPRFQAVASAFERTLFSKLPRMRELLQELLSEQKWLERQSESAETSAKNRPSQNPSRYRLRLGTSFEVELQDPALRWKGRVDAITLTNDSCSISDLKTGEQSVAHIDQLKIYSILWEADKELNPDNVPIGELKIYYGSSSVSLDLPTKQTMKDWRSALADRTARAEQQLALSPVPAHPSGDNCRNCQTKLQCNEYWKLRFQDTADPFQDLELTLVSRRGSAGWLVRETGNGQRELLLTRPNGGAPYWDEMVSGTRLRLTDAHFTDRDGELPLVLPTTFSETLLLG
jgi:hypothetical protein